MNPPSDRDRVGTAYQKCLRALQPLSDDEIRRAIRALAILYEVIES